MSLFPAYSQEAAASSPCEADAGAAMCWTDSSPPEVDAAMVPCGEAERELLESSDSEPETAPAPAPRADPEPDYYVDRRFDGGNLRVSTIYYPGRPQYDSPEFHLALGLKRVAGHRKRTRRYWEAKIEGGAGGGEGARAEGEGERGAALRRALVDNPRDVELWLQYIDYQEWVHGAEAARAASEAAAARAPDSAALRARRLALLQRTEAAQDYVTRLRDEITQEKDQFVSAELWCRLISALACEPAAGVSGAGAAAAAAARACRRLPAAYPNILYTYGSVVRAAGLWETLVLLLELVLAAAPVATPAPPAAFPPPRDPRREQAAERRLQDYEDKVVNSGLPSGAVWSRVERARGAAHWRPARAADADADADPQRAPALADVADLVLPCADPAALFLLLVNALRLAKVPLLPGAQYVHSAAGAGADEWDCGEALLALVAAARRMPRTHAAHTAPGAAQDLLRLAVDPPHYFSDDYGYRGWVEALWEAALAAAGADGALALLCWRLRWLHAQLLLLPESGASAGEARRIRDAAQASLKRWGGAHALAFALFARLAHAAAPRGGGGRPDAGRRAALVALRAALQDAGAPHAHLLYIARIVDEVHGGLCGALSAAGARALASAVLRRAPPADCAPAAPPPPDLLREARDECERRCASIEEELATEPESEAAALGCGARLLRALLPAAAEWGAARALLADPARRHRLLQRLLASPTGSGAAARWREQQAAALALRTRHGTAAARELSRRYPNNAVLALGSSGCAPWSHAAAGDCSPAPARALGGAWPALLRVGAAAPPAAAAAAGALARRLRRRGAGAAALPAALRLEAEARAPAPRLERVAHAAMDALPAHKNNQQQIKMDMIARSHSKKRFGEFWKRTKSLNPKSSLPASVSGLHDPADIANAFKESFRIHSPLSERSAVGDSDAVNTTRLAVKFSTKEVATVINNMAFDLVDYKALWNKLQHETTLPPEVVLMLRYWYGNQRNRRAYSDLRVQYNNAFRVLLGLPRHCSASGMFAEARTDDFAAIMRKRCASLLARVRCSTNGILSAFADRWDSALMCRWTQLHVSRST
ncbi:uncharacterized protein LOC134651638 [Cydia amplana]|uniref:uncharacterized protein LOC134651638 n=1 Tax=Cydia amplana TaxID=1869771 RepID=UPI002FE63780